MSASTWAIKILKSKNYVLFAVIPPCLSQCLTHSRHSKNVCRTEHFQRVIYLRAKANGQNIPNRPSSHLHRGHAEDDSNRYKREKINTETETKRGSKTAVFSPSVILRTPPVTGAADIVAESKNS